MPMHRRNVDRHGLAHLQAEKVKAFDRLKIPVPLVFFTAALFLISLGKNSISMVNL